MNEIIREVRDLIRSARKAVLQSVDLIQVLTNFEIGRRIVEHEKGGAERAVYGKALLKELSSKLTIEFGRGFSRSNLEYNVTDFTNFLAIGQNRSVPFFVGFIPSWRLQTKMMNFTKITT